MTVGDVQLFVSSAIGGATVGKRLKAWPATRLIFAIRRITGIQSKNALKRRMPILTPMKQQITLGDVADIKRSFPGADYADKKRKNARPASWIYADARG